MERAKAKRASGFSKIPVYGAEHDILLKANPIESTQCLQEEKNSQQIWKGTLKMKCMKIYVAGPYTGNTIEQVEENVRKAMEAGLIIWKKGHFPYIPHLTHWPDILSKELGIEMDWEDYMKWHAPWVDDCDALFLLAESKGALLELQRATEEDKIIFRTLDEIPEVSRSRTWADAHVS